MNDVPRRHLGELVTRESHSIFLPEHNLMIPLLLKDIFSGFPTQKMIKNEMITCNEMDLIHLTPDGQAWDTHDESYAYYEDIFLYFNEDLRNPPPAKKQQLIEEVENRFFFSERGAL